eukprot:TRINITY_DN18390_c0_g1_i2.p1 TRINITY_DN18390_c0_g1~~TRINITY_DN18390_c0_g1_i2.p1  ORF type:complete len:452 (-),score=143.98 TRINITY_DN18390_c0_g1_i2:490-1845(-)
MPEGTLLDSDTSSDESAGLVGNAETSLEKAAPASTTAAAAPHGKPKAKSSQSLGTSAQSRGTIAASKRNLPIKRTGTADFAEGQKSLRTVEEFEHVKTSLGLGNAFKLAASSAQSAFEEADALQQELTSERAACLHSQRLREELAEQLQDQEELASDVSSKLAVSETSAAEHVKALAALREEVAQSQRTKSELQSECSKLRDDLSSKHAAFLSEASRRAALSEEIDGHRDRAENMQKVAEDADMDRKKKTEEMDELAKQYDAMASNRVEAGKWLEDAKNQKKQIEVKFLMAKDKHEEVQDEVRELLRRQEALEEELLAERAKMPPLQEALEEEKREARRAEIDAALQIKALGDAALQSAAEAHASEEKALTDQLREEREACEKLQTEMASSKQQAEQEDGLATRLQEERHARESLEDVLQTCRRELAAKTKLVGELQDAHCLLCFMKRSLN